MKNLLTSDRVVKPFDPKKHSTLVTDTLRLHGIGYALMHKDSDGKLKFAGHIASVEGIRPDPEQLDAIRRFPTPTSGDSWVWPIN